MLENRASFRSVQKELSKEFAEAVLKELKLASGRLNGAEIARSEGYKDGIIPLHTLKADIDYAVSAPIQRMDALALKCGFVAVNSKRR